MKDKRLADPNILKKALEASREPHPAMERVLNQINRHPSKHLSQLP